MLKDHYILDNHKVKVFRYLQEMLSDAKSFRIVAAYFTLYGYELLEDYLLQLEDTKFLFGDPESIDNLDPNQKTPKTFNIAEKKFIQKLSELEITPNQRLTQKFVAQRCENWIKQNNVQIRSMLMSNFLHGKMYLTESPEDKLKAIVGSSNFTWRGLGGGKSGNIEINLADRDYDSCSELRSWFDQLWRNNNYTEDAKERVLKSLRRLGKEYDPEFVYFKTLYELFRKEIDVRLAQNDMLINLRLDETQIWKQLYDFQKDAALTAISRLDEYNGCILADSVGLGKTYTALAVIKYFELKESARVLVLCPKRLRRNWALYPVTNNFKDNPFLDDRFNFILLSHTDLSRESGYEGDIDFSQFNWSNFDLIVIDESHNFRNDTDPKRENGEIIKHSRYSKLMEVVLKTGVKTKVLMLSATPVNTSLSDLKNQINLFTTKQQDALKDSLGIDNIDFVLRRAQTTFDQWSSNVNQPQNRDKSDLLESLQPDFIKLLCGTSIARSRRQIEKYYSHDLELVGNFPERKHPKNIYPKTDLQAKFSYTKLSKEIDSFKLAVYRPSSYVIGEEAKQDLEEERKKFNFNQEHREKFLVGMIRTNYLKRLESSAHSLSLTLERAITKIDDTLHSIDTYQLGQGSKFNTRDMSEFEDNDDEDDELVVYHSRKPLYFRDLDLMSWKQDLLQDKTTLMGVYDRVRCINPARDGKLARLKVDIRNRVNDPTTNDCGEKIRKLLIFTVFADTAIYLYTNLESLAKELSINIALVTGDTQLTSFGRNTYEEILTNFSPRSRGRNKELKEEIDILVATDCISEGQNLQDCDTVLNYDIHWNPVRLIQRLGRIDRIASKNQSIRMINYWPTKKLEKYLNLKSRVYSRIAMADIAGTGDDDLLNVNSANEKEEKAKESAIRTELSFRDRELEKLKETVPDLDQLNENIVMSDFTLDDYFSQLMQYLRSNQRALDDAPSGIYSVTDNQEDAPHTGVIFALKQFTDNENSKQTQFTSPIHPYYLAYVSNSGKVRFGCSNVKQILEIFSSLTINKDSPLLDLCDQFDSDTKHGQSMDMYTEMLNSMISSISRLHRSKEFDILKTNTVKGRKNPKEKNQPMSLSQFELLSWLVVKERENG